MMSGPIRVFLFALALTAMAFSQTRPEVIPLWTDGAPGFEDRRDEPEFAEDYWIKQFHDPSVTVFISTGRHPSLQPQVAA